MTEQATKKRWETTRRVSGSWNVDNVMAASRVVSTLLAGGDARTLVRSADFRSFAKTVYALTARANNAAPPRDRSQTIRRRLRAVMAEGGERRGKEWAEMIGASPASVRTALQDERKEGYAEMCGHHLWRAKAGNVRHLPVRLVRR